MRLDAGAGVLLAAIELLQVATRQAVTCRAQARRAGRPSWMPDNAAGLLRSRMRCRMGCDT
ncbi:hypothetical protein GW15_0208675 [Xanthomonas axonopodis pv. vasculorum]|uniref:Uncharacterized protein n=1 Tax=Xanthomonas axonopodis pv. vasculorum TaxID=325777 RepID=A0A098PZ53_9XANT|nr:hypothetical protein GW15_0208675 [Xanthomonas axonopodis pv. vasculorum]